jgi:hypothetical protein
MIPSELRAYLKERGQASLMDMAAHFNADSGLVQDLLAYWRKKGRILETVAGCGKACRQCEQPVTFYQWRE